MCLHPRMRFAPVAEIGLNQRQSAARDRVLARCESGEYQFEEVPCFCGVFGGKVLAQRDRYGLPVTTILCTHCGILRTSPRFDAQTTERFYREDYRDLYSGDVSKQNLFDNQLSRGRDLFERAPGWLSGIKSVFDVGCGAGGMVAAFEEKGVVAKGCDYDPPSIEFAKSRGLNVVEGTVSDLLAEHGSQVDLVMLHHVMEHYRDLRGEVEQVLSAVRPGGFLLVNVPGVLAVRSPFYQWNLMRYLQNAHNFHFSKVTLQYTMESLGLVVLAADELAFAICQLPDDWAPGPRLLPAPQGEARAIIKFLEDTESEWQKATWSGAEDVKFQLPKPTPWAMGPKNGFRAVAWPLFDNPQNLESIVGIARPLTSVDGASLVIRHDPNLDIPLFDARKALDGAIEKVGLTGKIAVQIVSTLMGRNQWRDLGVAVDCSVKAPGDLDGIREEFYKTLNVKTYQTEQDLKISCTS